MQIKTHTDLIAWQKSYELAKNIYTLTAAFPNAERFGLCSQLRRSAIAIPSNIAEGSHWNSRKEHCQFCFIAYGSANELQTHLALSKDLGFSSGDRCQTSSALLTETLRLLNRLCHALKENAPQKSHQQWGEAGSIPAPFLAPLRGGARRPAP